MCKGGREWGGVCKSGGECLKVCNSVSLGAVWGFCIEVSVQRVCKGVCKC